MTVCGDGEARRFRVPQDVTVRVTINDPDVIERITGTGGDEWRSHYYDIHTEADVLNHLAYNAASNGVERVNRLEGWADLDDDAATMWVIDCEEAWSGSIEEEAS